MFAIFKKRQNLFFKLLHDQAYATLAGLEAFLAFIKNPNSETSAAVKMKEKEADEFRRILICELNKSVITPIDREDIFALSRSIDDILDYAYSTVTEIEMLKVKPTNNMEQIAKLLRDSANEILLAVDRIQDHPSVANEHAQRAKALENKIEDYYRASLADLFSGAEDVKHVIKILKYREIYRHLSNAADRGDEAANIIAGIVMKVA
jgi:predicted phosphate transport protein (TIGR00153 family)